MLQFQDVLSIYKIEFWFELTVAIFIWENVERCFSQKYIFTLERGGEGRVGQDLDIGSTFRIEFLICE